MASSSQCINYPYPTVCMISFTKEVGRNLISRQLGGEHDNRAENILRPVDNRAGEHGLKKKIQYSLQYVEFAAIYHTNHEIIRTSTVFS